MHRGRSGAHRGRHVRGGGRAPPLTGTCRTGARLSGARLTGACLSDTCLTGVALRGAALTKVIG
ncbi:pentapeptide repeat-containing protein [Actinomadura oligospora]|uniref:pentapeptide repeat-containing protein n=1 Tax=Actinomadura oligospora TaxID=111804 RepID=UPI003CCBDE85